MEIKNIIGLMIANVRTPKKCIAYNILGSFVFMNGITNKGAQMSTWGSLMCGELGGRAIS